jgi:hypothetical protein
MIFKEDMKEAKERMKAWWNHEVTDRPVICYYMPRPDVPIGGMPDHWCLAKNWDAIDQCLDKHERAYSTYYFGGENIPSFFPNYGPGILASVLGVEPEWKSNTVWFHKKTSVEEIVPLLESIKLNDNNPWYVRLKRITEVAAKRAKKDYTVTITDLGGILDVLASFLEPNQLILAMKRKPDIIDTCRSIILEKWLKVYDELQNIVDKYGDGCSSWMNIWCPKHWYPLQCDFAAMLSPTYFHRFVLPDLKVQAEHLDYAIYHLDGQYQLPFVDDLLKEKSITGIQWVPGSQGPPVSDDKWLPLLKKMQVAGKNLHLDPTPEFVAKLYNVLDPKGLFVQTVFIGKIAADFYLPTFMGGMAGIDDED